MTIEEGENEWGPTDLYRLWRIDCFGNICALDDPVEGDDCTEVVAVDPGRTPDWVAHPAAINNLFARYREIRRTLDERSPEKVLDVSTPVLLLRIEAKLIVLIKCLIGVYNFFHAQDADDPGARYSTLLSDDPRNDLFFIFVIMDACLGAEDIRSPEAKHVREHIDDAMKMLFDMIASIASERGLKSTHGNGLGELRGQYRSFHVPHPGKGNGYKPARELMRAFAKVADALADQEGRWMRERPEPTLRRPVFGVKLKGVRYVPNKIVADAFEVSINTIINWNKGTTKRPFDYEGPYPDTPADQGRMYRDAELHRIHKTIATKLQAMTPVDRAAALKNLPPRYAQFQYGLRVHGTGNRKR